jgi:6-phosphogluconolactonase
MTDIDLPSAMRLRRREVLPLVVGGAVLASLASTASASAQRQTAQLPSQTAQSGAAATPGSRFRYIGTYTAPNKAPGGTVPSTDQGVYAFRMDGESGGLTQIQVVTGIENPSWVTTDPQGRYLYATSEVDTWQGQTNSGGITAFSIDPSTGMLTQINQQPTMGAIPAHSTLDPSGKFVLVANYTGANFVVLPIQDNGGLGPAVQVVPLTGNGPDPDRQTAPFAHQIQFDPAGKYVVGNDLGTDHVWVYTFDASQGKLTPNSVPSVQVASGSGPRHSAFHPSGKFFYIISEMGSSVTVYHYDATKGTAIWRQTVSTLPPDFAGNSTCAELVMHPTGRFVYGSKSRTRQRRRLPHRPDDRHAVDHRLVFDPGPDSARLHDRSVGQSAPGRQPELGHGCAVQDRRQQRQPDADQHADEHAGAGQLRLRAGAMSATGSS